MSVEKYLSLTPFMEQHHYQKYFENNKDNSIYALVAVVFHQGLSLQQGRFTSLCRSISKVRTRMGSTFDYDWIYHDGKNTKVYNESFPVSGFAKFISDLISNAPLPMHPYILVYRLESMPTNDHEKTFSKRYDVVKQYLHDPKKHPFPKSRTIDNLLDSDDEYKYSQPNGMF
jgi:hypothetical protein